ncbi:hypothetical protein AHiyo8_37840 [Arthrobacter sp. Hiyo8]|nr:hypothetical protein AHiyo8_37840 [Arthrobacter sp. Hiyo8]
MSLFTVLATSKIAAGVLAAGAVAVGGTGVAAFNGALPNDLQKSAHELLGAPAPVASKAAESALSKTADASRRQRPRQLTPLPMPSPRPRTPSTTQSPRPQRQPLQPKPPRLRHSASAPPSSTAA